MSDRPAPRPEWAIAYILQDWTKRARPILRRAYATAGMIEAAEYEQEKVTEAARISLEADLSKALTKLRAYVTALEQVVR